MGSARLFFVTCIQSIHTAFAESASCFNRANNLSDLLTSPTLEANPGVLLAEKLGECRSQVELDFGGQHHDRSGRAAKPVQHAGKCHQHAFAGSPCPVSSAIVAATPAVSRLPHDCSPELPPDESWSGTSELLRIRPAGLTPCPRSQKQLLTCASCATMLCSVVL